MGAPGLRCSVFSLLLLKTPLLNPPRPLAPYSSADPALPDSPLIGPPSPRIRNSQQMWASRLFSGMWSICTGIRSLVTRPAPLRHPDSWPPGPANAHTYRITGFHTRSILLLSNPRPAPLLFCFIYGSAPVPPTQSGTRVLSRWSRKKRPSRPG